MPQQTWILTDADRDIHLDTFSIGPGDVKGSKPGWSVTKRTLRGGLREGVEVVEVDNGQFRFTIVPTRGMGIWRGWIGEAMLGWQSPVRGPVHPRFVPVAEPSGLGWLDGFDELVVRCGLTSNGAPEFDENHVLKYAVHGRIANLPAHFLSVTIDNDAGEISVTGQVDEARLHFQKLRLTATVTTRLNQNGFTIRDQVRNLSASPAECQMLYHINVGLPFLDAGSKLVLPAKTIVPRTEHAAAHVANWDNYPAPQPGAEEQVYFFDLLADRDGKTQALLKNAHGAEGVGLAFNKNELPYFAQWKNMTAAADGYVTGIEPATNFPNPRSYEGEQGRVVTLPPNETQSFQVELDWHRDAASVAAAEVRIAALQGNVAPQLFDKPQPGWCAGV